MAKAIYDYAGLRIQISNKVAARNTIKEIEYILAGVLQKSGLCSILACVLPR